MNWPDRNANLVDEKKEITDRLAITFGHPNRLEMLELFIIWLEIEWQGKINSGAYLEAKGIRDAIQSLKTIGDLAEKRTQHGTRRKPSD